MSFLTWLALGVGALAVVPLIAHLLRKGSPRTIDFAATELLARVDASAQQRSRLRDRALLAFRLATVVALALLGATPLVRCSRLSVGRPDGASVALAIVLDDSHSMRARTSGSSRFERGRRGALELLDSMRAGDAVSIVLSGQPARIILGATTDLRVARRRLQRAEASDRGSDLEEAVQLAGGTLADLAQPERRIVVLSDLAGFEAEGRQTAFQAPLPELRRPANDCGLVGANRRDLQLTVEIACSPGARGPRTLEWDGDTAAGLALEEPESLRQPFTPSAAVRKLSYRLKQGTEDIRLRLRPEDDNPANDRIEALPSTGGLLIASLSDPERSRAATGGAPLLEQALRALRPQVNLRPLAVIPDHASALKGVGLLVMDDPGGLSPEVRTALGEWMEAGGVALNLLGPASSELSLSAALEPFVQRSARWQASEEAFSVDPASLNWLGTEATSLQELTRKGRMGLAGALLPQSEVLGQWDDGTPFLVRRRVGKGLAYSAGLPVDVELSDWALRAGFLSFLQHLLTAAEERRGPRRSLAGDSWWFSAGQKVEVTGPGGLLEVRRERCEGLASPQCDALRQNAEPYRAGVYRVAIDGQSHTRQVFIPPEEILVPATDGPAATGAPIARANQPPLDLSRYLAWTLLAFFVAELGVRAAALRRATRAGAAS